MQPMGWYSLILCHPVSVVKATGSLLSGSNSAESVITWVALFGEKLSAVLYHRRKTRVHSYPYRTPGGLEIPDMPRQSTFQRIQRSISIGMNQNTTTDTNTITIHHQSIANE